MDITSVSASEADYVLVALSTLYSAIHRITVGPLGSRGWAVVISVSLRTRLSFGTLYLLMSFVTTRTLSLL